MFVYSVVAGEYADTEKRLCHDVFEGAANLVDFRTKVHNYAGVSIAVFS